MGVNEPDDLYGLPLERFVPERTALVRKLRDEGRRDEAAEAAKLPKPSVAAWGVNQLVRTQSRAVSELLDAGDALQKEQSDLIAGRSDGEALHEAAERERAALDALMERARGLLSSEGHELSQATLDRVAETLHAAAVDEEIRTHVQDGSLKKELRHSGLGGPAGLTAAPTSRARKRTRAEPSKPKAERPDAPRTAQRRPDRERASRLEAARKAESDSRRAAQIAAKALEKAQERRDLAAAALREADSEVSAARARSKDAERIHQRARQELDRIK